MVNSVYSVESESSVYLLKCVDEGESDKMKQCERNLC